LDLHGRSDLPWLLGGDINEIFYNFKKKGGPEKSKAIFDHFRDTFSACNLHDLGYWAMNSLGGTSGTVLNQ